jgi:hypothetical protein
MISNIISNLFLAFLISTIIFAIYVELSPKMGNIWYRINSLGTKTIQLENLFYLMSGPLMYSFYWVPSYFDINYIIYFFITFVFLELSY